MTTSVEGRWSIRAARLLDRDGLWDLEVDGHHLGATTRAGPAALERPWIDVGGRLVMPGFVDCHVHLLSMARQLRCFDLSGRGITDVVRLGRALVEAAGSTPAGRWLDAINFEETVMSAGWLPTRSWLDRVAGDVPARLQHGNQRFDVINSAGMKRLAALQANAEGQVFGGLRQLHPVRDEDAEGTLRDGLAAVSQALVAAGVTAVQDAGAHNGASELALLARTRRQGVLRVGCAAMVGGDHIDDATTGTPEIAVTHVKLECLENRPMLDKLITSGLRARDAGLAVAVHAVTETEVAMALAVLTEITAVAGAPPLGQDRIEHAGQTSDALLAAVATAGVAVVANPSLVKRHGARYRALVPRDEHQQLHRLHSWSERGVPLAIASDAPVTACLPLTLMRDACSRHSPDGYEIGSAEELSPREAIDAMTRAPRRLLGLANWSDPMCQGAPADLVVVDGPMETYPGNSDVVMTLIGGAVAFAKRELNRELQKCPGA